ncbi:MAG: ATP-binding protein [Hyphomicrobiaceae bacterium]|nr:ATP-binding protein [Hyphomicrobiaceae bacterium]
MTWLTDTIAGRTIIVLVVGLGSILAVAQYLYQRGIEREVSIRNTEAVVERLLVLTDTIMAIEPDRRDDAAHSLSGGLIELHWGREPLATAGGQLDAVAKRLHAGLISRMPRLGDKGLVIGSTQPVNEEHLPAKSLDARHTTLLSIPLTDGSWLNVTLAKVESARAATPSLFLSALLAGLGVVVVSILMSYWLSLPLRGLAENARRLFATSESGPIPESGTREVRMLAAAINELQDRIRKLIDERTQMLAAVSHDLRTPLTRLRLRVASMPDRQARRKAEVDLDEMEAMIEAILSFLRDDLSNEAVEHVDIMAILETLEAEATDAGRRVAIDGPRHIVVRGRHLALKRALDNLVQNALKYGDAASVRVSQADALVAIVIEDEGPGLPLDQLEQVFEPFVRGEPSRARATGGHGLGLTVARSILRSHGGDVTLENGRSKGLVARVELPAPPPS